MASAPMDVDAAGIKARPETPSTPETPETPETGAGASSASNTEEWIVVDEAAKASEKTGESTGLDKDAELDLCFISDCTGSMGQYIKAAQENIQAIVAKISQSQGANVQFGLISYRDHPPQDSSYITQVYPFTKDLAEMSEYVNTMKASGGGDGPEAVTAGLFEALHLPWRPNSTRICVLIADAPPHGIEPTGDGFPNGDPEGRDPLEILRNMAAQNITVYSVGCEPALGSYVYARDFLCTVAELTGGQAVALNSASMLADVIINGSSEELHLSKLQRQVEEEVHKVQVKAREAGRQITTDEAVSEACEQLQRRKMKTKQMDTDGHMTNRTRACWGLEAKEKRSLSSVKAALKTAEPERFAGGASRSMPMGGYSFSGAPGMGKGSARGRRSMAMAAMSVPASAPLAPMPAAVAATENCIREDLISKSQVSRMVQRAQCQNRLL